MKDEEIIFDDEIVPSNEDGTELSGTDQVKKLREKVKKLEKEKQEYLDGWQRARADYANAIKTAEEDKKAFRVFFAEQFSEDLFPVLDSFDMAMKNRELWEKVDENWRRGVEYIHQQLLNSLSNHNFAPFCIVGDVFDPNLHEAVESIDTDDASLDNTIAEVLQCGYRIGEKVLRPARVKVYSKQK